MDSIAILGNAAWFELPKHENLNIADFVMKIGKKLAREQGICHSQLQLQLVMG